MISYRLAMRINFETDSRIIAAIKFYKTIQIFRNFANYVFEIKKPGNIIFGNMMHRLFSVLLYKTKKRYSKENSIINKRKKETQERYTQSRKKKISPSFILIPRKRMLKWGKYCKLSELNSSGAGFKWQIQWDAKEVFPSVGTYPRFVTWIVSQIFPFLFVFRIMLNSI